MYGLSNRQLKTLLKSIEINSPRSAIRNAFLKSIEINSPRSAIRNAFQTELIADADAWLDMLEKRNLSSHTYDTETAQEIYRHVAQKYIFLLDDLAATVNAKLYTTV